MKNHIGTKIIATLGPASSSKMMIRRLLKAGVNIFRLNLSHGDFESHRRLIENIREASKMLKIPAGIMIDLPGPKIRIGRLPNDSIKLEKGDTVYLKSGMRIKEDSVIPIDYPAIHKIIKPGMNIFINDGAVKLNVINLANEIIESKVEVGGEIGSRKGVNIPAGSFAVSPITRYDKKCVKFAVKQKADFIAMSFVRKGADLQALRQLVNKSKGNQFLIAKIEKPEAIENFDSILAEAGGLMLARGDLGIEIPIEKVPVAQKQLLARCNSAGKPAITATQVLDSMVKNPRPTRAEAADAANAILDRTDALMLSRETAVGKYPVETVEILRKIIHETEKILETGIFDESAEFPGIADCVARSVVETAENLKIKIIMTPTRSGHTARLIARYRPKAIILAVSENRKTVNDLILTWGVDSILMDRRPDLSALIKRARTLLVERRLAKSGDRFIITSGSPVSRVGETNVMVVETV